MHDGHKNLPQDYNSVFSNLAFTSSLSTNITPAFRISSHSFPSLPTLLTRSFTTQVLSPVPEPKSALTASIAVDLTQKSPAKPTTKTSVICLADKRAGSSIVVTPHGSPK